MIRNDDVPEPAPAYLRDEAYPRPQLRRDAASWLSLDDEWDFGFDDGDEGLHEGWFRPIPARSAVMDRRIRVPFPPESHASGIGDTGFHPVVWYRRRIERSALWASGNDTVLHFGAVDYRAMVWLDGMFLGSHEGGSTPFSFDVTEVLAAATGPVELVVRAEDDPFDAAQPRGKQDWRAEPHGIWYERTTGIWQTVWLESVPALHVLALDWAPDLDTASVAIDVELNRRPTAPVQVTISLRLEGEQLADVSFTQTAQHGRLVIPLHRYANGQEQAFLQWSPEQPRLVDCSIEVHPMTGTPDQVTSYFGIRSVGWRDRYFLLNDRPYYIRAVLEQGYWPGTHLASPDKDALRREVQLIKDLGFNTVRIHQKVEDPRFLYWADRLGLLVWGENASAYEFSSDSVERMTREWSAVVRRDRSHPSVVVWVPLNESWGVQQIAHDPAQLDYAQGLYHLTKALDPSRPVVSNDGWEHAESDLWTIHDYSATRAELAASYLDTTAVREMLSGIGPLGRRIRLTDGPDRGQPVIVSEFGGIGYIPTAVGNTWGYTNAGSPEEFEHLLTELFEALQASPLLAGFCYTQLTDTFQEANGLVDAERTPKLPLQVLRSIVSGEAVDISAHRRPKQPVERPQQDMIVRPTRQPDSGHP